MRFVFTLLAASLTFVSACKKSGGSGDAIAKMSALKDKMCACKDKPCVDAVNAELTKWTTDQKADLGKASDADQQKLAAVSGDLTQCMTKVLTDTAPAAGSGSGSAAGSDTAAGSGSGSGSDATAAMGSGSAADATEPMPHRAGMCPSTVLGATTSAAQKGKSVVVTVEAADKDAIAAIQRRADELLAEKKDAPTGNGHDMKGTHGGGQGLCPVYVPEGAKATAKHEPKGVVVTITPKDKPADLAREITGRATKATEWVKSHVKDGDKGNQGGVGGGSGDDGSNHSGKGDGKGHDRRKANGGGGGKGTGGGGSTGDGSGSSKGGW